MSYRIAVKRSAAKALKRIPKPDRKRIIKKIDSLAEYRQKDVKGKTKSKEWVCDIKMQEYKKLLQDFQELPSQEEMQSGFQYVEERLITAVKKYGLDNYIDIATSWCKNQT